MTGSQRRFGQVREMWQARKDLPATLGIAMAAIAVLFVVGIIVAFNSARIDSLARQEAPATTASAPAKSPQAETTGSSNLNRPALPTPQNTRP